MCNPRQGSRSQSLGLLILYVLITLVNTPNLALVLTSYAYLPPITTVLAPAVFMSLALYALAPRLGIWLFILAAPLAPMETLYILRYERVTDEHVMAIIRETDIQEASAWLGLSGWLVLA